MDFWSVVYFGMGFADMVKVPVKNMEKNNFKVFCMHL